MKKIVIVAAVIVGLVAAAGTAAAQPIAATSTATPVGSTSTDVFCAVLAFLKGGWAGRPGDCTF